MGIFLEGFTLFSLVGFFLTIMVTISGCIQVAMGLLYMFLNYLLVTMYFLEPWSWVIHLVMGLFLWYWHQHSCLWGGHYAKKYALWLLVIPWVHISIGIVIDWFGSWEKCEGYASVRSWYLLLSSEQSLLLCIIAYPTRCWTVTLLHKLRVIKACGSTVLILKVFYLLLICSTSSLFVLWWPRKLLITSCVHCYRVWFW